jgi:hypothetical protein
MSESNGEVPQDVPIYKPQSNELVSGISSVLPQENRLNQDHVQLLSKSIGTHYSLPEETIQRASQIPVDFINTPACMRIIADATFEILSDQHGIPPESKRQFGQIRF